VLAPEPIGLHEQLPESDLGRCRTPRCRLGWLWYQRVEPPTCPKRFFFCRALRQQVRGLGDGLDAGGLDIPLVEMGISPPSREGAC
jgi:hypothetical protein